MGAGGRRGRKEGGWDGGRKGGTGEGRRERREEEKADGRERTGTGEGRGRGDKRAPSGGAMSRVAQERDRMGTLNRRRQAGMASNRSFIERRGVVDTRVALLNLFFLTADTCLDFTMLIATDALRHTTMIQALHCPSLC